MPEQIVTEAVAARTLAEFLTTTKYEYGERKDSPLTVMVQNKIRAMAQEIATELLDQAPQLRRTIEDRTRATIDAIMRDEGYLNDAVVKAVAKVLGANRSESRLPDVDDD